ncbi:hypothetical protein AAIL08_001714 [Campylobacter upsaliensis]|uniref:hypothetical protein n=1 Tax=Campylobacter upsaliensis TaxID=28080 RepID=UPI001BDB173F|nr:hypothetical protein [Campylobacter upsaliensis]EHK5077176.1 hypothetical protein [Campylobacter upsaliensis]EHP6621237.1 hypothetical protein [Campylobacter upsaliensis]EHV9440188.1 hypothetical protein [Campylobacter upsaliensis]EIB1178836.1 hypothetical protein [Campylobacter upsaliensis]EIO6375413.1 hypothetical protein [Campylobacter upsaliensis]
MLGTRIVLDEEKIIKEGVYCLKELYTYLDSVAEEAHMIKQDKFTYFCQGDENDLASLGIFTNNNVVFNEAITKNLKEWVWLKDNIPYLDVIEEAKKEKDGIWN